MTMGDCLAGVCRCATDHPATTRLVGLCPLLAVSDTVLKAWALCALLGLCMGFTGMLSRVLLPFVTPEQRTVLFVLLGAFAAALASGVLGVACFPLLAVLGVYPALLAGNCLVLDAAARGTPVAVLAREALGVALMLTVIATCRELLGHGTLFGDLDLLRDGLMPRPAAPAGPLPLLAEPAGALLLLGAWLALAQWRGVTVTGTAPVTGAAAD